MNKNREGAGKRERKNPWSVIIIVLTLILLFFLLILFLIKNPGLVTVNVPSAAVNSGAGTGTPSPAASPAPSVSPAPAESANPEASPVPTPEGVPEGGGKVNLTYSDIAEVSLKDNTISYMASVFGPASHDISLEIYAGDVLLAKSGTIPAGQKSGKMPLEAGAAAALKAGETDGTVTLYFLDRETGENAGFSTVIPVKITVK